MEIPFIYTLMWYKKEGGSVIKSLDVQKIKSLAMIQSHRTLSYMYYPKSAVILQAEATAQDQCVAIQCIEHEENPITNKLSAIKEEYYTFLILQNDGKEHVLRGAKVDRVMKWINTIAMVSLFVFIFVVFSYFIFCLIKKRLDKWHMINEVVIGHVLPMNNINLKLLNKLNYEVL